MRIRTGRTCRWSSRSTDGRSRRVPGRPSSNWSANSSWTRSRPCATSPGIRPFGSCFLCVVEVKDARGLLPSCTTRVRDGMEVVTRSDRITRARKTALALLLSDHYADCACPGQLACPAGVDVQGYLGLARLGHYREALRLIRERNPCPSSAEGCACESAKRRAAATWWTNPSGSTR